MARMECYSTEITYDKEERLFYISQDATSLGEQLIYITYDQLKWLKEEADAIIEAGE